MNTNEHEWIRLRRLLGTRIHLYILVALLPATLMAAISTYPTSPTVSKKESMMLEKAAMMATTNRLQAVDMLRTKDLAEASAAIDFAIGNFLFQEENLDDAQKAYQSAITKLPTFRDALKNLGRIRLLQGRGDDAIGIYQSLIENGIADSDSMLLLGHALILRSHYVPAENAYRQALLLSPNNSDAQQGLVKCLLEQERYKEARSLLGSLLDTNSSNGDLWLLMANVNVALDSNAEAITALETAYRLDCCSAMMLGLLGDLYLNAGQPQDAVLRYEEAIEAGWNEPKRLLRAVEGLIMIGDAKQARAMLNLVGVNNIDQMQLLQAQLAVLEEKPEEAINLYQKIIIKDPLNGEAILKLGDLQQSCGDTTAAELSYERAGRLSATKTEALVKRGQLAVQNNQFKKAVKLLEAAQAIAPQPNVERYLQQVRRLAE